MGIPVPTQPIFTIAIGDIDEEGSAAVWPRKKYDPAVLERLTALLVDAGDAATDLLDPIYISRPIDGHGPVIVSDGRHRVEAHRRAGLTRITAIPLPHGTDLRLFAIQQTTHGATKLTTGDTKRLIHELTDDEARHLSDAQIARHLSVSRAYVSQVLHPKPPVKKLTPKKEAEESTEAVLERAFLALENLFERELTQDLVDATWRVVFGESSDDDNLRRDIGSEAYTIGNYIGNYMRFA